MSNEKKEKDGGVTEVIKRVISIGVGAAFMTEDAVKSVLNDLPLPKDLINGLIQNAKGIKEDFLEGVREEVHKRLGDIDTTKMIDDIIQRYDLEVNATFKLKPKAKKNGTKGGAKGGAKES